MPEFYCTHCGQPIEADHHASGMLSVCSACGGQITVPTVVSPVPAMAGADSKPIARPAKNTGRRLILLLGLGFAVLMIILLSLYNVGIRQRHGAEMKLARMGANGPHSTPVETIPKPNPPVAQLSLAEVVAGVNQTLPTEVDEDTILQSLFAGPGKKVTYFCRLFKKRGSEMDQAVFTAGMRERLVEAYGTNPGMAYFRDGGIVVVWNYADADGKEFSVISVGPDDL